MTLGGFPRIVDGGDATWLGLGVVLLGVEADLVAVRVVQQGQDPADAGPVHAGVLLALLGKPGGELVDRLFVGHADGEVVESGGRSRPLGDRAAGPAAARRPDAPARGPSSFREGTAVFR